MKLPKITVHLQSHVPSCDSKIPLQNCLSHTGKKKNKHIRMKVKLCRGLRLKPHGHKGNDAGGFPLTVKCFVPLQPSWTSQTAQRACHITTTCTWVNRMARVCGRVKCSSLWEIWRGLVHGTLLDGLMIFLKKV